MLVSVTDSLSQARLLAGRALALEGEEAWTKAIADYQQASAIADLAGYTPILCLALFSAHHCSAAPYCLHMACVPRGACSQQASETL